MVRRQVAAILPYMTSDPVVEGMGYHPVPADSLPLIGANDHHGKGYSAFRHQHVGLTAGAKTGRIIRDLVDRKRPNTDLAAFDPLKNAAR